MGKTSRCSPAGAALRRWAEAKPGLLRLERLRPHVRGGNRQVRQHHVRAEGRVYPEPGGPILQLFFLHQHTSWLALNDQPRRDASSKQTDLPGGTVKSILIYPKC